MRFAASGIFAQQTSPPPQRLYRKEQGQPAVTSNTAADIRSSEADGSPLPIGVRQFMEPRFGADFSGVKIHTGDKAARLNRQLSADAFAVGNNIFFGKNKFQPGSHEGRELIAHELTHTLQQGGVLRRRTVEVAGKTMWFASDGRLIELPPDMTDAEATRLEAQAKAAEKKLGKGPAPKPVPDVKKLAKKEEKKGKPKPVAKGKKGVAGRSKGASKAGAGMATLKVGPGKVAQYLAAKARPALAKGIAVLHKLKQNEQTHDDAAEKLKQSEKAVVIPPSEGQSKSNTGQVTTVNSYPPPAVDDKKAKQQLQDSLEENFPRSIEDVDNFKRDQKAQHMGADVMKVVQRDKNAVSSTFQEMEHTPPPVPPEHPPEALPPEEIAPPTANMDLGQGAVPSLQKEHTDVTSYTKEADARLQEEGVTQEQLDMVDSGDLAEANKEKKGLQKAAQTEPLAVQKFAQREAETVQKDLKQEEKKERGALKTKRKAGLSATAKKQLEAKKALEKKREEVASKINGIFQAAQDKVKKKLADLENESMKRFDDGNAKATREFEDNVNRELGAFKADRYSGWFGWARKAKDWLLGMDDLPEVKAIFERNRSVFVNTINKLVEDISIDNKRVIQECKDELANATKAIKEYVDKLEPGLKDIGNKTAEEMNGKLQELDQFVNKKEEELRDKLKDKQTAAIKAIDEKIEKMKEAMSGALAKLGKLLLAAAKKFFTWALEKCGVSLSTIEGIINKGVAVLKAIFTQPVKFVKNLMNAAITGFKNFGINFLKHLKDALFEWLTGSLEGIKLPQTWDLKGIIGVALQMIGISYANIRKHMVTVMTEPVVAGLERTFTLVKTLITEGPMAAWEQLKEMAGEMRDAFVDAVKDFIKQKIIEEAIKWLVSLFIPGAGLIKAAIGIYDTIVFFIQKAKQIIQMVSNFLGSIAEIAAGNIAAAADAMEKGLARGLSLVISFLAQLLRMSGITDKIKNALEKIRAKVDAVLLKVAKWIADKAKPLIRKGVGAVKAGAATVLQWWRVRRGFTGADRRPHTISVDRRGSRAVILVRSDPKTLEQLIEEASGPKRQKLEQYLAEINGIIGRHGEAEPDSPAHERFHAQIEEAVTKIIEALGIANQPHRSVVTWSFGSFKRARQVIVDPLTREPGNTRGAGAVNEIRFREYYEEFVNDEDWASQPIHGTHLLAGPDPSGTKPLHGPTADWNIANAWRGTNMRMKPHETSTRNIIYAANNPQEVRYVAKVNYFEENGAHQPPPIAQAKTTAQTAPDAVDKVEGWLKFITARSFDVSLQVKTPPQSIPVAEISTGKPLIPGVFRIKLGGGKNKKEQLLDEIRRTTAVGALIPGITGLSRTLGMGFGLIREQLLPALARDGELTPDGDRYRRAK